MPVFYATRRNAIGPLWKGSLMLRTFTSSAPTWLSRASRRTPAPVAVDRNFPARAGNSGRPPPGGGSREVWGGTGPQGGLSEPTDILNPAEAATADGGHPHPQTDLEIEPDRIPAVRPSLGAVMRGMRGDNKDKCDDDPQSYIKDGTDETAGKRRRRRSTFFWSTRKLLALPRKSRFSSGKPGR